MEDSVTLRERLREVIVELRLCALEMTQHGLEECGVPYTAGDLGTFASLLLQRESVLLRSGIEDDE